MRIESIWKRVEITGSCWLWKGQIAYDGYGILNHDGKSSARAHRVIYSLLVGELPDSLTLDHICFTRNCVNPDHLDPVTQAENSSRRAKKKSLAKPLRKVSTKMLKPNCKNGHILAEVGILKTKSKDGKVSTRCRACQHDTQERNRRRAGIQVKGRRKPYGPRTEGNLVFSRPMPSAYEYELPYLVAHRESHPQAIYTRELLP